MWVIFLIGGGVALGIAVYRINTRRLMLRYGDRLRAYNVAAFNPIIEQSSDGHFEYVTRLAHELKSKKGQRAISVLAFDGTAIHRINQNGTFSAKGPYFVSWQSTNWRRTGTTHLVKVMRGKSGWGFKPDHYKQKGVIREKGIAILEYGTKKYSPVSIREFAELQRA